MFAQRSNEWSVVESGICKHNENARTVVRFVADKVSASFCKLLQVRVPVSLLPLHSKTPLQTLEGDLDQVGSIALCVAFGFILALC